MHERLPVHTAEREVNMINRNEVAKEKMQRAAEMLQDNNIDMWVFYARLKTDTALELMFNTDSKNEVMFLLTKSVEFKSEIRYNYISFMLCRYAQKTALHCENN